MSVVISPSETVAPSSGLRNVRVDGGVDICVRARDGRSFVERLHERDGYKVRFPRRSAAPEAILINTGGGLAGGDRVDLSVIVGDGASLGVTTQAAERCYRSHDAMVGHVRVTATVGDGATLAWLPQETILYDGARLERSIDIALAPRATLLLAETIVLGRRAMGETLATGRFTDRWRVTRGGRLIFAENVRIDEAGLAAMSSPAMTGGAHVVSTVLFAAAFAEDQLATVRALLDTLPFACATSAWEGKLVIRSITSKTEHVRQMMQCLVPALGGLPLPRVWST